MEISIHQFIEEKLEGKRKLNRNDSCHKMEREIVYVMDQKLLFFQMKWKSNKLHKLQQSIESENGAENLNEGKFTNKKRKESRDVKVTTVFEKLMLRLWLGLLGCFDMEIGCGWIYFSRFSEEMLVEYENSWGIYSDSYNENSISACFSKKDVFNEKCWIYVSDEILLLSLSIMESFLLGLIQEFLSRDVARDWTPWFQEFKIQTWPPALEFDTKHQKFQAISTNSSVSHLTLQSSDFFKNSQQHQFSSRCKQKISNFQKSKCHIIEMFLNEHQHS